MRKRATTVAIVTLVTLIVTSAGAIAASVRAPSNKQFDKALATMKADEIFGVFVAMDGKSRDARHRILQAYGLDITEDFDVADTSHVAGPISRIGRLIEEPAVSYLEAPIELELHIDTARTATNVTRVQHPVQGGPYRGSDGKILDGSGVGVAIVDTGIYGTHPDLAGQVAKNFKVVCETPVLVWSSGPKQGQCFSVSFHQQADSDTTDGHGTHVSGIVAGAGTASKGLFTGVAPGSKLYGFGVGDGGAIDYLQTASAFQWILENHATVNPPIKVLNNSWGCINGCPFEPQSLHTKLVNKLIDAGVTITWAAGNAGGTGTADGVEGNAKNPKPGLIGVANYSDGGTGDRNGTLSSSSSRGLAADATSYPDVSAPGSSIIAPCKRGGASCEPMAQYWAPHYSSLGGTSMAAPHVAGIVALLLDADPTLTPAQIEHLLEDTAHRFIGGTTAQPAGPYVADPRNPNSPTSFDRGHGLVDATAALEAIGVTGDGEGNHGTPSIETTTVPALARGTVTVEGTLTGPHTGLPTVVQLAAEDGGDYDGPGAADLVAATAQSQADGIRYTIQVENISDIPSNTNVTLRIMQNAAGKSAWTNVTMSSTGTVSPSGFNASNNQAPATSVVKDTAANTISFVVPYPTYQGLKGSTLSNDLVQDVHVGSYIGTIQDYAPGGLGADLLTHPTVGKNWTLKPQLAPEPPHAVEITRGSTVVGTGTITGTAPSYTWSTNLDTTLLPEGQQELKATLKIAGKPRGSKTFSLDVDNVVAAPTISSPEANVTASKNQVLITGRSEVGSTVTLTTGGAPLATVTPNNLGGWSTTRTFADGTHTIEAVASKNGLTSSTTTRTFSVALDTVAPAQPTITSPASGSLVPGTFALSGTAEAGSEVRVFEGTSLVRAIAAGAGGAFTGSVTLPSGNRTLFVRAIDGAGNVSPDSTPITVTVDATKPVATISTPAETVYRPGDSFTANGGATDNSGVTAVVVRYYDTRNILAATVNATLSSSGATSTNWTATAPSGLSPGRYRISAIATDVVGLESNSINTIVYKIG